MIAQPFSRLRSSFLFLPTTWLVFLMAGSLGLSYGQQPSPTDGSQASDRPVGQEFAPRGQRMAKTIKYSDWSKSCFKTPGTNTVCRTSISGKFETGQSAVRIDLILRKLLDRRYELDELRGFAAQLGAGTLAIPSPPLGVKDWPMVGPQLYALWDQASANLRMLLREIAPHLKLWQPRY